MLHVICKLAPNALPPALFLEAKQKLNKSPVIYRFLFSQYCFFLLSLSGAAANGSLSFSVSLGNLYIFLHILGYLLSGLPAL